MSIVLNTWQVVMVVVFLLGLGYVLGIRSRWVFKQSVDKFIADQLISLDNTVKETVSATQQKCIEMLQDAQTKSLDMYHRAVTDAKNGDEHTDQLN